MEYLARWSSPIKNFCFFINADSNVEGNDEDLYIMQAIYLNLDADDNVIEKEL